MKSALFIDRGKSEGKKCQNMKETITDIKNRRIRETFETEFGKELLKEAGYEDEYIGVGSCILGYPANGFPGPIEKKDNYYQIIK